MKSGEMIKLSEALAAMVRGETFSAEWVSYDVRRGGGEIEEFPSLRMLRTESGIVRNTHWVNFTRNFEKIVAGQPTGLFIKIHLPLILTFNGKKIIL
jgi:hypothetical protein